MQGSREQSSGPTEIDQVLPPQNYNTEARVQQPQGPDCQQWSNLPTLKDQEGQLDRVATLHLDVVAMEEVTEVEMLEEEEDLEVSVDLGVGEVEVVIEIYMVNKAIDRADARTPLT